MRSLSTLFLLLTIQLTALADIDGPLQEKPVWPQAPIAKVITKANNHYNGNEVFGVLDNFTSADYDGNRLTGLTYESAAVPFASMAGLGKSGSAELTYNGAGDLVSDSSRGITGTEWNEDGHPTTYVFNAGDRQYWEWDNFGNHISKTFFSTNKFITIGSGNLTSRFTIEQEIHDVDGHVSRQKSFGPGTTASFERASFDGGFFTNNSGGGNNPLDIHYTVTDYLGSVIAVIDSTGTIEQRMSYYPYGEPHSKSFLSSTSETGSKNRFLFGSKEYLTDNGLNEYFFEARNHVPAFPRFTTLDPCSEGYFPNSPYTFCGGNPVNKMDPTGKVITSTSESFVSQLINDDEIP